MFRPVGKWYEIVCNDSTTELSPDEGLALEKMIPHITEDIMYYVIAAFKAGQRYAFKGHECHCGQECNDE